MKYDCVMNTIIHPWNKRWNRIEWQDQQVSCYLPITIDNRENIRLTMESVDVTMWHSNKMELLFDAVTTFASIVANEQYVVC